ncbi:MAG: alcohol dehydrogenase catalytic domain-containing protein [Kineosporiaceae bacterium]
MRAVVFESFGGPLEVSEVPEPHCPDDAVVVAVEATGVCRSDWHGWLGHDPDIRLPHVPGHEFAGRIAAVGGAVRGWRLGERVTSPFVNGCGRCGHCLAGDHQVCPHQSQPGFTRWGSFADAVLVEAAEVNLVRLPDEVDAASAAALGCRFATAFRAVIEVGRLGAGQWLAVHGCGGAGLSAVMIGAATGAHVVAVDVRREALDLAARVGATHTVQLRPDDDPLEIGRRVRELTQGGAEVSVDAVGSTGVTSGPDDGSVGSHRGGLVAAPLVASLAGLRPRGRHVQIGLTPPALGWPAVPMHLVIAGELELLGSHGMSPRSYPRLLSLVASGTLRPADLVTRRISLDRAGAALAAMGSPAAGYASGVTVVEPAGAG